MSNVASCVIFVTWLAAAAAPRVQSAPEAIVDAFAAAWNAHDGSAFGRLYADDADWVMAGGDRLKDRAAIQAALTREHSSWARRTVLKATDVAVRELDRERAIVMFKWEVTSESDAGAQPRRGNTVLIAAKHAERWLIIAGQVAAVATSSK